MSIEFTLRVSPHQRRQALYAEYANWSRLSLELERDNQREARFRWATMMVGPRCYFQLIAKQRFAVATMKHSVLCEMLGVPF